MNNIICDCIKEICQVLPQVLGENTQNTMK